MQLKEAVAAAHLSYRKLARQIGISKSSIERLVNHGRVPDSVGSRALLERVHAVLATHGVEPPAMALPAKPAPVVAGPNQEAMEDIDLMQLNREVLIHFGLGRNPFLNDVDADEDVFLTKNYRDVSQAIRDTIEERGLLALTGPSGAGKTTIWDGIESEFGFREDTVLCKTQVKDKEKLSPDHLTKAIIYGISGEEATVAGDHEDRGRQLSRALRSLHEGTDRRCVLIIDDAHHCNRSVLRCLKAFFEEKVGRYRLLAIILIGLPELREKLALIPEIGRRTRVADMKPVQVKEYLEFKLRRVGSSLEKLFTPDGLNAFLGRFRESSRSLPSGFPLQIQEALMKAMYLRFTTADAAGEKINAELMDRLPGGPAQRQTAA